MGRLSRRHYDYFGFFSGCADYACAAADYLNETLSNFDIERVREYEAAMHKIENDADMAKHAMLRQLAHEFMTPIEREDIVALAQQLDNVVDAIEEVMRRVYMFNVIKVRPEALKFTELIVKCCRALKTAVDEFKHFRKSKTIAGHIVEVNSIESDGDKLFAESMRQLYIEASDTRNTLVWTTMFECLEACFDACEDAADIIEGVIMKNT